MPRRPDVPCAECGELMWRGTGSLPEGQATCWSCRRAAPEYQPQYVSTWTPESRICPVCGVGFTQERYGQKYCRPMCRARRKGTWKPSTKTTTERGYGAAHQRERRKWADIVNAGFAVCSRCDQPIQPGTQWHLDHTDDRTGYLGPAHAVCNLREAGRKVHRLARRAKNWTV